MLTPSSNGSSTALCSGPLPGPGKSLPRQEARVEVYVQGDGVCAPPHAKISKDAQSPPRPSPPPTMNPGEVGRLCFSDGNTQRDMGGSMAQPP